MHRIGLLATSLLAAATLSGCASSTPKATYFHPNVDLGAIRTVAVLPFENVTSDRVASAKVHDVFLVELLSTGAFEVVEPGRVAQALREAAVHAPAALTPEDFQALGERMEVDGFFLGTVLDFGETRSGTMTVPEVTIQLRLVEALSGVTVWSTSDSRSGATASTHLIGLGGPSLTEAARELLRRQLETLFL